MPRGKTAIADKRPATKGDLKKLRVELKEDTKQLRRELKGDINELRTELEGVDQRLMNVERDVVELKEGQHRLERGQESLSGDIARLERGQDQMFEILQSIESQLKEFKGIPRQVARLNKAVFGQ